MNTLGTTTLCVIAVTAALFAGQGYAQNQNAAGGPPNGLNVVVTNTPLPVSVTNQNNVVTGTVTVNNTASSPVPVTVTNSPSSPLVVREPARVPYQQTVSFNEGPGVCYLDLVCTVQFQAVPQGKRLVIQHASADFALSVNGTYPRAQVSSTANPTVSVALPAPIKISGDSYTASSPVTYYIDAGYTPIMTLSGQHMTASNTASATLVGYLVDVP